MLGQECKIVDSGELELEKPFKAWPGCKSKEVDLAQLLLLVMGRLLLRIPHTGES